MMFGFVCWALLIDGYSMADIRYKWGIDGKGSVILAKNLELPQFKVNKHRQMQKVEVLTTGKPLLFYFPPLTKFFILQETIHGWCVKLSLSVRWATISFRSTFPPRWLWSFPGFLSGCIGYVVFFLLGAIILS